MSGLEKKFATKSKIVNYIINRESTSKVEISKELNLSIGKRYHNRNWRI